MDSDEGHQQALFDAIRAGAAGLRKVSEREVTPRVAAVAAAASATDAMMAALKEKISRRRMSLDAAAQRGADKDDDDDDDDSDSD
jgi:hypothetical protein